MRSPDNIPSSIVQINKIRIYQFVLYTTRIITSRFYSEVVMASDSSFLGLKNRRRRSSLASGLSNSRPSPVSAPPATSSVPTAAPSIAQEPTAIGNERTIVWRSVRCSTSQVICEVKDITRIKVEWIPWVWPMRREIRRRSCSRQWTVVSRKCRILIGRKHTPYTSQETSRATPGHAV
jgi:hypothetical protein